MSHDDDDDDDDDDDNRRADLSDEGGFVRSRSVVGDRRGKMEMVGTRRERGTVTA